MSDGPLVCDTSLLLYLGRIGQVGILPSLFQAIYVPEAVVLELDAGRLLRPDTLDVRAFSWMPASPVTQSMLDRLPLNRLGLGERATIALATARSASIAGLDDHQARQLAYRLGLRVMGTLGIVLQAKRRGLVPSVRPLVDALQREGFRLSEGLYVRSLELAGEL